MSKKQKIKTLDIQKLVMSKINSDEINMKPKWFFVLGSILSVIGLIGFSVLAVFLANLTFFLLKTHGPNGTLRLQQILESFPIWIPFVAIVSLIIGIKLLKNYDFSYQKNFKLIVLGFIISVLATALFLDYTGLSDIWTKKGKMMRYYQQRLNQPSGIEMGTGRGYGGQHNRINNNEQK